MGDKQKSVAVIGSTGSIGQQTLDVIASFPERFRVIALAAGHNTELLARQIREFNPEYHYTLSTGKETNTGRSRFLSVKDIARLPEADVVVVAASGKAGLAPTLAAVEAGKTIALANKESLVMAGALVMRQAKLTGATIYPVDSEHSAIWQCLFGESRPPARLILTASGGPFRGYRRDQLDSVTIEQALKHPSWKMGPKITIDSATMMNKGLEIIEAHWLFDMPYEKIDVLIHPQSIIHSMVELADGSLKAQLGLPDMRLPIQLALTYPERLENEKLQHLDLAETGSLIFEKPDYEAFPCLTLAKEAGTRGGTFQAALAAADEAAVAGFLAGRIKFTDIARVIEETISSHQSVGSPVIADIFEADRSAGETADKLIARMAR